MNIQVQVRSRRGTFMNRYVHGQVNSCTGTFMYRFVHAQICPFTYTVFKLELSNYRRLLSNHRFFILIEFSIYRFSKVLLEKNLRFLDIYP